MTTVVERSVDIHAPAGDVWRILAHDFADAAAWNSLMKHSAPNLHADVPTGATVGGRVFEARGLGTVTEVITVFDQARMQLTYRPDKPAAVRDLTNSWSVVGTGPDATTVTMTARFDARGPAQLLSPLVARLLARSGETMLADVRTFLETGGPSPAKQKTTEKFARRDHGSNVAVQR